MRAGLRLGLTGATLLLIIALLSACGRDEPKTVTEVLPTDKAAPYEVLSVEDTSFVGRRRLSVRIVSTTARSAEQRAQTALKAAVDIQQARAVDAVTVFLEISPTLAGHGYVLASADYAPDGVGWAGDKPFENNTWEARTTDYVVPENTLRIAELWYENVARFQKDDGFGGKMTDEAALKKHLASIMHAKPSDIDLTPLMEVITRRRDYAAPKTD